MAPRRPTADDFRLARSPRSRYGLADLTLAADLATARTIAARMNAGRRDAAPGAEPRAADRAQGKRAGIEPRSRVAAPRPVPTRPARPLTAGELHAAGLLVAVLGRLVDRYRAEADPVAVAAADAWLRERLGNAPLDAAAATFAAEFPAQLAVPEPPDPPTALTQFLLLGALEENPAIDPFRELVDLSAVRDAARLGPVVDELEAFFATRPGFGPEGRPLVELLRQPAIAAPGSLADQLRWIRQHWAGQFGGALDDLLDRLLVALDILAEERMAAERAWFAAHDPGAGGPSEVYDFRADAGEEERFSADRDWMPSLVLIAKSTYVWLDQLSRRYGRDIRTLDAVPDEELDGLARWGISGLWLIGLWERSNASERIKRLRGDRDAVASAYSLDDYVIAADLGGDRALHDLARRAGERGIRLASDMVPNHMGIDSRWVIEHPDRFLSLPDSPFPAYSFGGPDLSSDERVGIFLEDHYYDATDAAVVFLRVDRWTGDVRYVYHGNDGTSFPWNDTAQLDYAKAAVREAVIQTILEVARRFPVIRFDAAMVLARKHIQRLWFPEPGHGGAIPSRAGHGLTRAEFGRAMPGEFWREVVDRVAAEVPGTLLLAEAFWLLEGYFVRTLGMHRVYNSAFMNMLRDERNAEYRLVIRNTLEFDPAILGRFVNFMSNPDERTAIDQFGTGDKYFGVAALMATLPGLPMFGHGQVEGFTEKYGMEFRRARLDEPVDQGLLAHHERTIFPLLHRRAIFAGSESFRLYDVVGDDGSVNEDVFAYSNVGPGGERSLVVYHNRYAEAHGSIRESVGFMARGAGGARRLHRESLVQGLGLSGAAGRHVMLRDAMSGLEALRPSADIARDGFRVDLGPFGCRVFVDLVELGDEPGRPLSELAARLGGGWVPSVEEALVELVLEPIRAPFGRIVNAAFVREFLEAKGPRSASGRILLTRAATEARSLAEAAASQAGARSEPRTPIDAVVDDLVTGLRTLLAPARAGAAARDPARWGAIVAWLALRGLGGGANAPDRGIRARRRLEEWRLGGIVRAMFRDLGLDEGAAGRWVDAVGAVIALPPWRTEPGPHEHRVGEIVDAWLDDEGIRRFLRVNRYEDVVWFDRDAFVALVELGSTVAAIRIAASAGGPPDRRASIEVARSIADRLLELGPASGYRVDRLTALAAAWPGPSAEAGRAGGR